MTKFETLEEIARLSEKSKRQGKTVGLITGCFDIIHAGHIELFQFAKKHVDIVIVGLENDQNIRLNKGPSRPIHTYKQRSLVLSEIQSIDYVFKIRGVINWRSPMVGKFYKKIYQLIKPNYLITNPLADLTYKKKAVDAREIGAQLLMNRREKVTTTTSIIQKLEKEF